ncbi:AP2/ERF and B3 domain-containing transcription factor At1g51120-like [Bidens hawaiensis]|uniref:AP2/ERF and B3 domain-containing transcription factor At1g51120-like n=1 Tax=Bidens hawaiensis TaxID=980011 RepID=UPI00404AC4D8
MEPGYVNNYVTEIDNNGYLQKYKGVVPQQNGNWGAQIYTNNQRIWLGTFESERDAAIAYDRASMKLRSADSPRNFPLTESTVLESNFQSHYSEERILGMIKDRSYQAKFEDYLRQKKGQENDNILGVENGNLGFCCRVLFQKELTPSDVGKLNRLVIPKKYAVRYFPRVPDDVSQGFANDEVTLPFYDTKKRLWKFRYCYWKSSQSFVFTRGWNQFVKEKKLMPKDKITFYYQENLEMQNMGFWVIDTCKSTSRSGESFKLGMEATEDTFKHDRKMDGDDQVNSEMEDDQVNNSEMEEDQVMQTGNVNTHGFKLFGVHIFKE